MSDLFNEGLTPSEFEDSVSEYLGTVYDHAWTLEAKTQRGHIPVGVVFGVVVGKLVLSSDAVWMPWASTRNKVESVINFVNQERRESVLMAMAPIRDHELMRNKRFLEHIAKHGIAKRVGTLDDIMNEPAALFQSRKPQWQPS